MEFVGHHQAPVLGLAYENRSLEIQRIVNAPDALNLDKTRT